MTSIRVIVVLAALLTAVAAPGAAQFQYGNEEPALNQQQSSVAHRAFGIDVSFPFALLPTGSTSGMLFLDLLAQGDISNVAFSRTELRFFFDSTGFQTTLTTLRESLLFALTPSPAVLYAGGGVGAFPIRADGPGGGKDGFLLSLFARTGVEVQVAPLGLFLDLSYEVMPQPFVDLDGGAPLSPGTVSALELSFGALFHF